MFQQVGFHTYRNGNLAIRNADAAPRKWRKGVVQQGVSSLLYELLEMGYAEGAKAAVSSRKPVLVVAFGGWRSLMGKNTGFLLHCGFSFLVCARKQCGWDTKCCE